MQALVQSRAVCAGCGQSDADMQRCSTCKEVWYCSVSCQNNNWRKHKKKCKPKISAKDMLMVTQRAWTEENWAGVISYEDHLAEMVAPHPDEITLSIVTMLWYAHIQLAEESHHRFSLSGGLRRKIKHLAASDRLQERKIETLGGMQQFLNQGEEMYTQGDIILQRMVVRKKQEGWEEISDDVAKMSVAAATWFEKTRQVAEKHGLFALESRACYGLAKMSIDADQITEAVELMGNAITAGKCDNSYLHESEAIENLIEMMLQTRQTEKFEMMIVAYHELIETVFQREKKAEAGLAIFMFKARFAEVSLMVNFWNNIGIFQLTMNCNFMLSIPPCCYCSCPCVSFSSHCLHSY